MSYRRLPSLTAIRAFEAAARHRSMNRAAGELCVTAGAISRQVRALEEELRLALFLRSPAGLALTPAGDALFAASREALDRLADGVLRAANPGAGVSVSLGAYTLFASRWLIPRLGRLRARHPTLDLALTTTGNAPDLVPGRFDAVIAVAAPVPRPGLEVRELLAIETVPVCAPHLAGFDWPAARLLHSRQRPNDWARWLAAAGIAGPDPHAGSMFESIALALDAAAEGLGVAMAIRALVEADLAAGRVVLAHPFHRRSTRSFVLLYETARAGEGALMALEAWLNSEASALAGHAARD